MLVCEPFQGYPYPYLRYNFTKYGIEEQYNKAVAVIQCESSWRINPPHNGVSLGIAQFTAPTWKDFGTGKYEDINPYLQLSTLAKMWSLGLQRRWDCYVMLFGN